MEYENIRSLSEEEAEAAIADIGYGGMLAIAIKESGYNKSSFGRAIGLDNPGQSINGWIVRNGVPAKKAKIAADLLEINPKYICHFVLPATVVDSTYISFSANAELSSMLEASAKELNRTVEQEAINRINLSYAQEDQIKTKSELVKLFKDHVEELKRAKSMILASVKDLIEQVEEEHAAIENVNLQDSSIADDAISALQVAVDRVDSEIFRVQGFLD